MHPQPKARGSTPRRRTFKKRSARITLEDLSAPLVSSETRRPHPAKQNVVPSLRMRSRGACRPGPESGPDLISATLSVDQVPLY
jgi:hypothetical protein